MNMSAMESTVAHELAEHVQNMCQVGTFRYKHVAVACFGV